MEFPLSDSEHKRTSAVPSLTKTTSIHSFGANPEEEEGRATCGGVIRVLAKLIGEKNLICGRDHLHRASSEPHMKAFPSRLPELALC